MGSSQAITAVTGGSHGIGAAIVERLAADGHDVLIGYQSNEAAAEEVARRVQALGMSSVIAAVHVTDPKSLDEFFRPRDRTTGHDPAPGRCPDRHGPTAVQQRQGIVCSVYSVHRDPREN